MKSVFEQYKIPGKDKDGHPTEFDILTKEKAFQASQDIIMKWNDLPEQNAQKYLNEKFDKTWKTLYNSSHYTTYLQYIK